MSIQAQLSVFGFAQVLVYLKDAVPKKDGDSKLESHSTSAKILSDVSKHFTQSSTSRPGAIAAAEGDARSASAFKIYKNLGIVLGTVDPESYKAVKESDGVRAVTQVPELSLIRPTSSALASPKQGPTWGIKRLRVPELWDVGFTGKGIVVAHLDTGIDGNHSVFKGAIHAYAEFDNLGREIAGAKPRDSGTHGTHTAATIAGRPTKKAIVGVAPGAKLASAMVIEGGGNIIARILGGMDWSIAQGAKILSMSLGLRGYHEEFLQLMRTLRARGLLPVIASGNEGPGTSRSPGSYDICLSVGACDSQDEIPDFSSSQHFLREDDPFVPDLVGPGADVLSAMPGNKFGIKDGTSMATPHIAGLAALLWDAKPDATVDEIEKAILKSCRRAGTMPRTRANRGIPDAVEAVKALIGSLPTAIPVDSRKAQAKSRKQKPK